MAKKTKNRIYWRKQGRTGELRAYGDFRDFKDVGGGQEALIPKGRNIATEDPVIAEKLVADRLIELQSRRRNKTLLGLERQVHLAEFAAQHLVKKAKANKVTNEWLSKTELRLRSAIEFFGATRTLDSISPRDVTAWLKHLSGLAGRGTNRRLSQNTLRHYLGALSNLYRRAGAEQYVSANYNPVSAIVDKPTIVRTEARWLEVDEAAAVIQASREHIASRSDGIQCLYPLIATFLLTGGRQSEVLGLEVSDISFERGTVTFRPNKWRRLKTRTSARSVPLWPQLEAILIEYLDGPTAPTGGLLFPSARPDKESMIYDLRKSLDHISEQLGHDKGWLRTKMFRHTYCAARLQTMDNGEPVSMWTVAQEMGHGGLSLVNHVYGYLGRNRHRNKYLEYRLARRRNVAAAKAKGARRSGSPIRKKAS